MRWLRGSMPEYIFDVYDRESGQQMVDLVIRFDHAVDERYADMDIWDELAHRFDLVNVQKIDD